MSGHVFISYAGEDKEQALRLAKHLRAAGIEVWLDEDLRPGEPWPSTFQSKINDSSALIVLDSSHAAESEWVAREITAATRRGLPIIPIRIAGNGHPLLAGLEHEDVDGDTKPSRRFLSLLRFALSFWKTSKTTTPVGRSDPRAAGEPIAVPDTLAMLNKIYDELLKSKRSARIQFWVGTILGLPLGVLGSYLAYQFGWA